MSEQSHDRVTDPVCGMQIRPEKAAATIVHDGSAYFFCAEACRRQFELEPDRYVGSSESE
jgi:YHS domain-containing protein